MVEAGSYEVDIPWDYLEKGLAGYLEQGLVLEPDFQRGHVWSDEKRTAYVEFCLRGGRGNRTIFFNCPGWHSVRRLTAGSFVLVDGLQRLTAVRMFMRDELRAFGSFFSEYTDRMWLFGLSASFRFNVNRLETRAEVLRWYLDMNTGGVVHAESELDRVRELLSKETV